MAKREVLRFYTNIKQEGSEGATRGKIPVAMGREMGAKDGDVIEWEVVNGDCVGGRVLSKSERKEYERENARASKRSAPSKPNKAKKAKSGKRVVEDDDERPSKSKGKKKLKKPSKGNKRATKVSYEAPTKKSKVKLKKKLKKPKYRF